MCHLLTLPSSCHAHLLPYTADIEQVLLHSFGHAHSHAHSHRCSKVLPAVHRVLVEWTRVRGDAGKDFISPVLRWLVEEGKGDKREDKSKAEGLLVVAPDGTPKAKRRKTSKETEMEESHGVGESLATCSLSCTNW